MQSPQALVRPVESLSSIPTDAVFVGHDIYRERAFGDNHPLAITRVSGVMDLCELLGWLDRDNLHSSPRASARELARFHDTDYINAVKRAGETGKAGPEQRRRYHLGTRENPVFKGLYRRATTAVGGSIRAAGLALSGRLAFHPAGGTHHGRPDRASGFCYFNDPVFAILTLLDAGLDRVLYVDLDAHHGDGVQEAFSDDPRVFMISIHEEKRWPRTGLATDRAGGNARNLPVPASFNDNELDCLMEYAVLPLSRSFEPQALVIVCGADALDGDPLSRMALSNVALWTAVEQLLELTRSNVVLGGGGYNPWTVIRCWSGLWGLLSGHELPPMLPAEAQDMLLALECDLVEDEDVREAWTVTLADPPNTGPVRTSVTDLAEIVRKD